MKRERYKKQSIYSNGWFHPPQEINLQLKISYKGKSTRLSVIQRVEVHLSTMIVLALPPTITWAPLKMTHSRFCWWPLSRTLSAAIEPQARALPGKEVIKNLHCATPNAMKMTMGTNFASLWGWYLSKHSCMRVWRVNNCCTKMKRAVWEMKRKLYSNRG